MRVRSLPHFAHKAIGKSTHKKGMSYSHVNYITRDEACSKTLAQHMPADRDGARPYFERMANKEGVAANARIADTLIIALPLELTAEQRHDAIERFMDKIGKGRIAWLAAFHDLGEDAHNPHCHLIFRDADIETGRKVVGTTTSAKDVKEAEQHGWRVPPRMTTKDLRDAWCDHLNGEMERHGLDVRFDQRRLKERGVDREPEIHVGPKAMSMAKKGRAADSRDRERGWHTNAYSLTDTGSRAEHDLSIIEGNRRRSAKSGKNLDPARMREGQEKAVLRLRQVDDRKSLYAELKLDRKALRQAQHAQKLDHQRWARALYAKARTEAYEQTKAAHGKEWDVRWAEIRGMKDKDGRRQAEIAQKSSQKATYEKAAAAQVEQARPIKNEAWHTLLQSQATERQALDQRHRAELTAIARQHVAERQAITETWRHHHLTQTADRISAKLQDRSALAPAQRAGDAMIGLHADSHRVNSPEAKAKIPAQPLEAAKFFSECAVAERGTRDGLRTQRFAERKVNLVIGNRGTHNKQYRGAEKHQSLAERNRTQDSKSNLSQAAQSGQALSEEQRANLSAEDRAQSPSERGAKRSAREERFLAYLAEKSGKGRNGGRSGR